MLNNIAFLGVGWITTQVYYPIFKSMNKHLNIGIYDSDKEKITEFCKEKPVRWIFDSIEALLKCEEIDLIIIATPNYLHYEQTIKCLSAGKYVLCEKPLCITIDECEKLQCIIEKYSRKLFIGLQNRFREDVQNLSSKISSIGNIYKIKSKWIRRNGIPSSSWFLDSQKSGGGTLIDLGPHIVDLVLWLVKAKKFKVLGSKRHNIFTGKKDKYATWHKGEFDRCTELINVEDNVTALIELDNFTSWYLEIGWAGNQMNDETVLEFYGDKGFVKLDTLFGFSENSKNKHSLLYYNKEENSEKYVFNNMERLKPYMNMLNCYISLIESPDENDIDNDVNSALIAMKLIMQIYNGMEIIKNVKKSSI
ncbi:Gfo/Idh/MocA family oxidoreductase [Lysinibacillus sp. FSL K6-3209]|uniref:Gfo/Idh/MocA family protein n=1 Tax=Lysinibacillus sp. FSL K6-3209 TaxID=2921497 RepID=UPI0030D9A803